MTRTFQQLFIGTGTFSFFALIAAAIAAPCFMSRPAPPPATPYEAPVEKEDVEPVAPATPPPALETPKVHPKIARRSKPHSTESKPRVDCTDPRDPLCGLEGLGN